MEHQLVATHDQHDQPLTTKLFGQLVRYDGSSSASSSSSKRKREAIGCLDGDSASTLSQSLSFVEGHYCNEEVTSYSKKHACTSQHPVQATHLATKLAIDRESNNQRGSVHVGHEHDAYMKATKNIDLMPSQCPRCLSWNTKFRYYNNMKCNQPRFFCRSCKKYWTLGGALRWVTKDETHKYMNQEAKPLPWEHHLGSIIDVPMLGGTIDASTRFEKASPDFSRRTIMVHNIKYPPSPSSHELESNLSQEEN
ncbi:hypothetical protein O6H91_23G030000 [Diphasiastrum complanatum]|uniref:Uncharacterized protein n=1 Tax=Diphasiastrum complanatum TaxID=34168 RepID=A0ACC2A9C5_DIPCM|nr:hypothetical protein O6H91_23G030000 [Diphasiastrum complanatum]